MADVFEISPPKRFKKNAKEENSSAEILYLAPFKPIPKIVFENVKIHASEKRCLVIKNPSVNNISGQLLNIPSEDRGFEFSFTSFELSPGEETLLEIAWTPSEAGNWRFSIPVRTTSKLKCDIILISSSIDPKAKKNAKKNVLTKQSTRPTLLAKKLVMSKPHKPNFPKPAAVRSVVQQHVRIATSLPKTSNQSPCRRQTFLVNPENKENSPEVESSVIKKSKHDISRRFEDFVLSPLSTNLSSRQTRSNVLDELVASPVTPSIVVDSQVDVVDGDSTAHSKIMLPLHARSQNVPSNELRRATFDIGHHQTSEILPPGYLSTIQDSKNEFYDSLDELSPENEQISPTHKSTADHIQKQVNTNAVKEVPFPDARDSFMNSTINFDMPLPSEDPRRCSTSVKVLPASPSRQVCPPKIRKDLFDLKTSPQKQTIDISFALGLDVSQPIDILNGEISESLGPCANDRLSTSTYIKDRLSTDTYVKDRLSTETYIKDHNSKGSCSLTEDSCDEAARIPHHGLGHSPGLEKHLHTDRSPHTMDTHRAKSPRFDDGRGLKSPLGSIQEEEISSPNFESGDCFSNPRRVTAFTVPLDDVQTSWKKTSQNRQQVAAQQKKSPRSRKIIKVSPCLKKPCSPILKPEASRKSVLKPVASKLRRESIGGIEKRTERIDRRLSLGPLSSKVPLSSRLPESRLSLSRKDQPAISIPRGSKRIAQMLALKSEPLEGVDDILAAVTNVDPFAATTTSDPFLNQAIYNDSNWIAQQENHMIKWLNALLTPPAELETTSDQVIDIGDLWQKSCRSKNVNFAPSREEVSSDIYDKHNRLNSVRKGGISLIRSESVSSVLQKISVRVDQKVLAVRDDRDLHLDVGLQHIVLKLLLCYNPLWLRIGLEVVYGKTVPLKSNNDYVGLTAFIVHNLLSDTHIVDSYSHPTVPHLKLPGFEMEMKKFILKKFLFVVIFLDQAKTRKLIGHDPCLFLRSAEFKESREIVTAFAKDLLAGIGDVNRYLASLGCKLTVKQTYLDEFEYAVKALLDLRDGVRLCRVMELILCDHSLHARLRVPAISRLQKIHNVELALDALKAAGYQLAGGITAKDIADGHKEKTLSLLWQIIYKFQGPRFAAAAETIQRWWRKLGLLREVERRIRARKRARRERAAIVLQSSWRAHLARRRVAALREERARELEARTVAAVVLQKHWRRHAAERTLVRARQGATSIARWYRGALLTRRLRADFLARRAAAVKIQAHCRGLLTRLRFADIRRMAAALRIQTWYRRRRAARLMLAAVDHVRRWQEARRREEAACRVLQAHVRSWLAMRRARARLLAVRAAVVTIQRRWRARQAMRAERAAFLARRQAVVTIQRWVRACASARLERSRFLALRSAALFVQRQWRGRQMTKTLRVDFLFKRRAALVLQRSVRAWLAGRSERRRYLKLLKAIVTIQLRFRATKKMQLDRSRFLDHRKATLLIQRKWRAQRSMVQEKLRFDTLRGAALTIQRQWRSKLLTRQLSHEFQRVRGAVVLIQKWWILKMLARQEQQKYQQMKASAIVIQRAWRKWKERQTRVCAAAVAIQRWWSSKVLAKQECQKYKQIRTSAIVIQRAWRTWKQKQTYQSTRNAVIVIQKFTRGFLARKKFFKMREDQQKYAALCEISARRIQLAWRKHRKQFDVQQRTKAAVTIQAFWRGYQSRKKYRKETSILKKLNEELHTYETEKQSMKERIGELCVDLEVATVGRACMILNSLNTICLISPILCDVMVENDVVPRLFKILCNINRGVAESEVARMSTKILLQLCKYEITSEAVWQDGAYLNVYHHLMKKWLSVTDTVLLHFLTMLWHFSQCPLKAKVISNEEKIKSTMLSLVPKFKNRKSKTPNSSNALPSIVPNWGSLKKNEMRPSAFEDPLYAIHALCFKLKIDINV